MATKILVDALSIKALKVSYPIFREKDGTITNKLAEAIADGTLNALVDESVKTYCNGNTTMAIKALRACLSSYKVNIKKASSPIDLAIEQIRIETLTAWLDSFGKTAPNRNEVYGRVENGKPKWDVSAEDIIALVNNVGSTEAELEACYKSICSIYNCIASKLSKDLVSAELDLKVCGEANPEKKAALQERVAIKNRIMAASAECTMQKAALRKKIVALQTTASTIDTTKPDNAAVLKKLAEKKGKVTLSGKEAVALQAMLKELGMLD